MTPAEALGAVFGELAKVPGALATLTEGIARLDAEVRALRQALPPRLGTLREAADLLGVSYATVRRRVRDGSLPVRRVGRALRVDLGALRPVSEEGVARTARQARTHQGGLRPVLHGGTMPP